MSVRLAYDKDYGVVVDFCEDCDTPNSIGERDREDGSGIDLYEYCAKCKEDARKEQRENGAGMVRVTETSANESRPVTPKPDTSDMPPVPTFGEYQAYVQSIPCFEEDFYRRADDPRTKCYDCGEWLDVEESRVCILCVAGRMEWDRTKAGL